MQPATQKIFLSYARRDANIVHEIYTLLQHTDGVATWYDKQDIIPAKNWDHQIKDGLDSCESLLLVASRYSIASENVKREVDYFLYLEKPIYVALVDHTPLDPDIAHCPLVDLRADPLDRNHWRQLIQAIREEAPLAPHRTSPNPCARPMSRLFYPGYAAST